MKYRDAARTERIIYDVYLINDLFETNYTSFEENAFRYIIMEKEENQWKIADMVTGL